MTFEEFKKLKDPSSQLYSIWRNGALVWLGMTADEVENYAKNTDSKFTIYYS